MPAAAGRGGPGPDADPVRVFISYAHEPDDDGLHERRVRRLWQFLRAQGVDARLDLPAADQPQDWAVWMLGEVKAAEFVLVVASPAYRRRAEGEEPPDRGRGARWEAGLIRDAYYADPDAARLRFLPVVLPGCHPSDIPAWMGREASTHYPVTDFTVPGAEALLRYLTGQPRIVDVRPLGPVPVLGPAQPSCAEEPDPLLRSPVRLVRTLGGIPPRFAPCRSTPPGTCSPPLATMKSSGCGTCPTARA